MTNKAIVILYALLVAFSIAGCESPEPKHEGVLVGTMKAYRLPSGTFVIVSDQNGDSFAFEMNLGRVYTKREEPEND